MGEGGGERGVVLVTALLAMLLLLPLGAVFLSVSLLETTVASNEMVAAKAFNIAEAGLEHAKSRLKNGTEASLNNFLSGTNPGPYPFGQGTGFAGGNYTVFIYDDADAGGDPNVDTNNQVFIQSTGSYTTAQKRIVALVRTSSLPLVPAGLTLVTTGLPVWDVDEANSTISGADPNNGNQDWSGTCPGVAGVVHSNNNINLYNNGIVHGVPGAVRQYDPATDNPIWNDPQGLLDLVDQWMAQPGVVTYTGNNPPLLGTEANPQITVWNPTGGTHPGALTGYGILILTDTFQFGPAPFNFHGLIIHRGGNVVEYTGTSLVRGGVVSVSTGVTDGSVEDTGAIKYDCDALTKYAGPLAGGGGGGSFTVLSWREVAM